MPSLAIVSHSGFGHTAAVAEAIASGASSVAGVDVSSHPITAEQITADGGWNDPAVVEVLTAADGIVFGAATYMGNPSWQFQAFAYATGQFWITNGWQDKIAGGFTASAFPAGDKHSTLAYFSTLAAQLRMIWVGPAAPSSNMTGDGNGVDPYGYYRGVGVVGGQPDSGGPSEGDLLTAELYGARLAESTARWTRGAA